MTGFKVKNATLILFRKNCLKRIVELGSIFWECHYNFAESLAVDRRKRQLLRVYVHLFG